MKIILIGFYLTLMSYLFCCTLETTFNIKEWHEGTRFGFYLLTIIFAIVSTMIVILENIENKSK